MKVLIIGCTGTRNFGDEMSAQVLTRAFRAASWEVVLVGSGLTELAAIHHPGVRFIRHAEMGEVAEELRSTNLAVYGPGTIVSSAVSPAALQALDAGVPVVIYAVGAGLPAAGSDGARLVKGARWTSARNVVSRDHMAQHRAEVHLVGDPILTLGQPAALPATERIGVCFSWGLTRMSCTAQTVGAVKRFIAERGAPSIYIPASYALSGFDDFDNDNVLAFGDEILRPSGFDAVMAAVRRCSLVVSSRLHLALYALACGIPVLCFGLPKIKDLLSDYALGHLFLGGDAGLTTEKLHAGVARIEREGLPLDRLADAQAAAKRDLDRLVTVLG